MMAVFRYAIVRVQRHWQIVSERRRIGLFLTADQAASAAARLSHEARLSGHAVELYVQAPGGELIGNIYPTTPTNSSRA